ncbi:MAG: prepilin-type N-terminal cleavage/methylation domain-containing protein, partial [Tyzzerella sp.]|nr:prepilin-type N-terminal cleavage/methylation domain-containing protein [Candidatus Fimicola merdigallinarum]
MFKSLMTKKLNKKGFTLAELLVVVAILAIL